MKLKLLAAFAVGFVTVWNLPAAAQTPPAPQCMPLEVVQTALNAAGVAYDVLTPPRTARMLELLADQLQGAEPFGLAILALGPDGALFVLLGRDGAICGRINLTDPAKPEQADQLAKAVMKHVYGMKVAL
jgi:hypothetical protein